MIGRMRDRLGKVVQDRLRELSELRRGCRPGQGDTARWMQLGRGAQGNDALFRALVPMGAELLETDRICSENST
jgi:hypothetical protein